MVRILDMKCRVWPAGLAKPAVATQVQKPQYISGGKNPSPCAAAGVLRHPMDLTRGVSSSQGLASYKGCRSDALPRVRLQWPGF